ncbi:MAG: four-carbon acid sugar kinase family protein [Flaviflexus sp.]|nr:four-carbon acid sugar kinase family protein [Flaviflexus sp.]
MQRQILVLADDLTGANATAVALAGAGRSAALVHDATVLSDPRVESSEILIVPADTRREGPRAQTHTTALIERACAGGIDTFYLKVDAALRGSVFSQIHGALHAWRPAHPQAIAVVCPADPAHGLTLEDGVLLADGVPADEAWAGRDSLTPATTSQVEEILEGCRVIDVGGNLAERIDMAGSNIVVCNAATENELEQIAAACRTLGERVIPVGSLGLARALHRTLPAPDREPTQPDLPPAHPPLIVTTSIHAVSQAQVDEYLAGREVAQFVPDARDLFSEEGRQRTDRELEQLAAQSTGPLIIRVDPSDLAEGGLRGTLARDFAKWLAELALTALAARPFGSVLAVGIDGARELTSILGITRTQVAQGLAEGVPLTIARDGGHPGLLMATKSGGFGDRELLVRVLDLLSPAH